MGKRNKKYIITNVCGQTSDGSYEKLSTYFTLYIDSKLVGEELKKEVNNIMNEILITLNFNYSSISFDIENYSKKRDDELFAIESDTNTVDDMSNAHILGEMDFELVEEPN